MVAPADHAVVGDLVWGQPARPQRRCSRHGHTQYRYRLRSQLKLLDSKEQTVSRRRRELHEQIDRLYLQAPLDDAESTLLDELEELERSISRERRRLHETIDALRAQIGLPRWREANELDNAA